MANSAQIIGILREGILSLSQQVKTLTSLGEPAFYVKKCDKMKMGKKLITFKGNFLLD